MEILIVIQNSNQQFSCLTIWHMYLVRTVILSQSNQSNVLELRYSLCCVWFSETERGIQTSRRNEKERKMNNDDERGLLWKLPVVKSSNFGKVGPAFGVGAGCGLGFGIGLLGGIPNSSNNQLKFQFLVYPFVSWLWLCKHSFVGKKDRCFWLWQFHWMEEDKL